MKTYKNEFRIPNPILPNNQAAATANAVSDLEARVIVCERSLLSGTSPYIIHV